MTINNPFIKDPDNQKWLQDNYQTFLEYMARHHSLVDCWHTILDLSTFDDNYIRKMIKQVEAADNKKIREEAARIKKAKGSSSTKSASKRASKIEEKQSVVERAVEEKMAAQRADEELLD